MHPETTYEQMLLVLANNMLASGNYGIVKQCMIILDMDSHISQIVNALDELCFYFDLTEEPWLARLAEFDRRLWVVHEPGRLHPLSEFV